MARGHYIYVVYDEAFVEAVFTVKRSALDYVDGKEGLRIYRFPDGEYGNYVQAVKIYPKEPLESS